MKRCLLQTEMENGRLFPLSANSKRYRKSPNFDHLFNFVLIFL